MSNPEKERAIRILARSMYRELESQGFGAASIMRFASEIMGMLGTSMAAARVPSRGPAAGEGDGTAPG